MAVVILEGVRFDFRGGRSIGRYKYFVHSDPYDLGLYFPLTPDFAKRPLIFARLVLESDDHFQKQIRHLEKDPA